MKYLHIFILLPLVISGCQNINNPNGNGNIPAFGSDEDEFENLNKKTDASNLKYRRELSQAVVNNNLEKIKFYLSQGANPNTTIFHAVENRNIEVVHILLENGADPNIMRTSVNDVPSLLMRASNTTRISTGKYYLPSPDMVDLLIKYGANINYENNLGNVISYIVCKGNLTTATQEKEKLARYNMVKFFIDKGVSVNVYCENDATPLANLYQFKYPSQSDSYYPEQKKRREENIKNSESIMAYIREQNPIVSLIENARGVEDGNPHGSWVEREVLFPIVGPFLKMH